MFTPKLSTLFASRWKALWWSASILMTAYCTVPSPDNENDSSDGVQLAQVAKPAKHSNNPWSVATPDRDSAPE
jgi:hypothetical protein